VSALAHRRSNNGIYRRPPLRPVGYKQPLMGVGISNPTFSACVLELEEELTTSGLPPCNVLPESSALHRAIADPHLIRTWHPLKHYLADVRLDCYIKSCWCLAVLLGIQPRVLHPL